MTASLGVLSSTAPKTRFRVTRLASMAVIAGAVLIGCGGTQPGADSGAGDAATDTAPIPQGLAVLGNGTHLASSVRVREISSPADGLATPRDLAFNPEAPDQLWVVNFGTDAVTVYRDTGTDNQRAETFAGFGNTHFLSQPSCLAFGAPGMMATAHEQDEATQTTTPADFMGPTLWDTNLDIFDAGHASHLDMLHNSPNAVGIAWERDNVYWVIDGRNRALARYDFGLPHEHGGEDHSDGLVQRFHAGEIAYVENVSSGAEFDAMSNTLYVADTGNNRIVSLDPSTAVQGRTFGPNYDGGRRFSMTGTTLNTFVDGASVGMERPSGLAIANNVFYVTDNANSKVFGFGRDGALLDWVDLSEHFPAGSMNGIAVDGMGRLYIVDAVGNRVVEISAAQPTR